MLRSLLFVPGDSDRKIARSEEVGADAIILDLEDSVAEANKAAARERVREYLASRPSAHPSRLFVRINPLTGRDAVADLVAVMAGRPDGIVLPKASGPQDIIQLGHHLEVLEVQHGLHRGSTRILPVATEVPQAMFALGGYAGAAERLAGITWGAEDLSAAVGATGNRDESGSWSAPFMLARSLCLFAASAAGVPAIDTLHADFRDEAGLIRAARAARRDGFEGMLAIHPAQVAPIHAAFAPSAEEVAEARRIVAAFAAQPEAGTLSLDGRMIDMPHLVQARKIIAHAERHSASST
jgi:citrate lyase subunit beta/citryl-CoA lyase